jgi:hypothetical protein
MPARRLALFALIGSLAVAGLVAIVAIDHVWNNRAATLCGFESEKPKGATAASGYTIQWETTEFAYVCRYDAPGEPKKRVGLTDAFFQ